jgi:hypothetical protein
MARQITELTKAVTIVIKKNNQQNGPQEDQVMFEQQSTQPADTEAKGLSRPFYRGSTQNAHKAMENQHIRKLYQGHRSHYKMIIPLHEHGREANNTTRTQSLAHIFSCSTEHCSPLASYCNQSMTIQANLAAE